MELKKYKLGDVADIVNGATPSTHNSENYDGSIIWITPKDLSDQKQKIIRRGQRNISEIGFNNCSAQMIPPYNILMSSRAPIGLLAINENECCTNQGFKNIVLDKSICDTDYMYYYLQFHMKEIEALGSGTTFKEISKSALQGLEIRLPNLEKQRDIAKCLSDLDRKIELNKQINDNLEAMAKQLYDYWFVQFDFPNEEGKPYKSSGGVMVWNEKLKRKIPQGWSAAKIKDVAQTYSGGTPTSTNSVYYDGGDIPWINSGELNNPIITNTTNYITEEGLNNSSAKLYPQDTVLVALYGATAGKVSLLSFEACSNQAVCGVIPQNKIMTTYIRYYLSSLYEHFITLSSGSARDNISQDTIKNTILPIPQGKILKEFSDAVAPIISKIIANQKEMENLTKQRDELLPLLMNGQASVNYHLSDD